MAIRTYIASVLWIAVVVAGCGAAPIPAGKSWAVAEAKRQSPLRTVTEVGTTLPFPPAKHMWTIYGRDAAGRDLVVWVRELFHIEGYIYLDTGVSRQAALDKVQAAGYVIYPAGMRPILEPAYNGRPVHWWLQIEKDGKYREVTVDFKTGRVTPY